MQYHLVRGTGANRFQRQSSAGESGKKSLPTRVVKKLPKKKWPLIGLVLICLAAVFCTVFSLQAQNSAPEPAPTIMAFDYHGDAWKLLQQEWR